MTERDTSAYLNEAYKQYINKSDSQKKIYAEDEYHNYKQKGIGVHKYIGKAIQEDENLAIGDIISHPETFHFL